MSLSTYQTYPDPLGPAVDHLLSIHACSTFVYSSRWASEVGEIVIPVLGTCEVGKLEDSTVGDSKICRTSQTYSNHLPCICERLIYTVQTNSMKAGNFLPYTYCVLKTPTTVCTRNIHIPLIVYWIWASYTVSCKKDQKTKQKKTYKDIKNYLIEE